MRVRNVNVARQATLQYETLQRISYRKNAFLLLMFPLRLLLRLLRLLLWLGGTTNARQEEELAERMHCAALRSHDE